MVFPLLLPGCSLAPCLAGVGSRIGEPAVILEGIAGWLCPVQRALSRRFFECPALSYERARWLNLYYQRVA